MGKVEDRPATYEDWLATPEGEWWELADGRLWRWGDPDGLLEDGEVTTPSADHERVVRAIFRVLDAWTLTHGGEAFASGLGVRMTDGRLLVPDALLVSADHLDRIGIDPPGRRRRPGRRGVLPHDLPARPHPQAPLVRGVRCPGVLVRGPRRPRHRALRVGQ
jgi:hypothetical protein